MINDWREPATRAVSIWKNPGDFSTDNGPLFTVVAQKLGLIESWDCDEVVSMYEPALGVLLRHPSSSDYSSWDDHLAYAVSQEYNAIVVLIFMLDNNWTLPNGDWLGRIPIFVPAVRAAAGGRLGWIDQIRAAGTYLVNCFEKREETSGKQLLWLSSRVLERHWLPRIAITLWRSRMMALYPNGLKDLFAIYYRDPEHPFHAAAGDGF